MREVSEVCLNRGNRLMISLLYSRSYTAVVAMKELITLSIEDPHARKTMHDSNRISGLRDMTKSVKPEISKWASRALRAIEDVDVHNFWSKVLKESFTAHELQHVLSRSGSGRLADLSNSLKYVTAMNNF